MVKKILGSLFLMNWEVKLLPIEEVKGTVMVAAPHTSNWDFLYAFSVFWKYGMDVKFLIKDTYTKSIFTRGIVKLMGGIGVNRSKKNDLVNYCSELFKDNPKLILIVPAEGSRKKSTKWKLGFYNISLKANVPITLGYLDYEKKAVGFTKKVYPSLKPKEELFKEIEDFFKYIKGKYPENFTPNIE